MLAPALHQLIDCTHSLTDRAGLPDLDRVLPLLLIAAVVIIALVAALRRADTSRR